MPIETLTDLPDGLLGFRAVGTVTSADYRDVLDPHVLAAVGDGTAVNVVYVLGEEFDKYSLGAMFEDARLQKVPSDVWGRLAVVTDHTTISDLLHVFAFAFPGDLRVFPVARESEAIAWASGTE